MTEPIAGALRDSALSFIGTVERLGAATLDDVPVDDHTSVVRVDHVLHAPASLEQLSGMSVTVQLSPDAEQLAPGDRAAFFTNPSVFGKGLAVTEVEPHLATAAPGASPLEPFQRAVADQRLRDHAEQADAVVVGKVVGLVDAGLSEFGEHDPDWWRATLDVVHVERGAVAGPQVSVLYANSLDVRWRSSPKPKASQEGLWLLHATDGPLRDVAPFQIPHPEEYQPATRLDQLRARG